eukprot:gene29895-39064_t
MFSSSSTRWTSWPWMPHVLLTLVQLAFSGWHIVGSLALRDGADPLAFAAYREIIASIVMVFIIWYNKQSAFVIKSEDYIRFCCLGFCSFVNVVSAILSLTYISATRYSLFQPSIPCVATAISIAVGVEPFSWIKAIGILVAVGGAVLIDTWDTGSSNAEESNVMLGSVMVSVGVCAMASLMVFQRPLLSKYESVVVTFGYYSIGTVITLFMCACWQSRFNSQSFTFGGATLPWIALVYASVFATAFAYNTYSYVSKTLSPSVVTIYSTLQPVGTAVLSLILFGKVIGLSEGVGGFIVALGLAITVIGRRRELLLLEGGGGGDSDVNNLKSSRRRFPSTDSQQSTAAAITIIPFSNPFYRLIQQSSSEQNADEKDGEESEVYVSSAHSEHDIIGDDGDGDAGSGSGSNERKAMTVPLLLA